MLTRKFGDHGPWILDGTIQVNMYKLGDWVSAYAKDTGQKPRTVYRNPTEAILREAVADKYDYFGRRGDRPDGLRYPDRHEYNRKVRIENGTFVDDGPVREDPNPMTTLADQHSEYDIAEWVLFHGFATAVSVLKQGGDSHQGATSRVQAVHDKLNDPRLHLSSTQGKFVEIDQ